MTHTHTLMLPSVQFRQPKYQPRPSSLACLKVWFGLFALQNETLLNPPERKKWLMVYNHWLLRCSQCSIKRKTKNFATFFVYFDFSFKSKTSKQPSKLMTNHFQIYCKIVFDTILQRIGRFRHSMNEDDFNSQIIRIVFRWITAVVVNGSCCALLWRNLYMFSYCTRHFSRSTSNTW